jgi:phage N-6-adenine-methyltransferase
VLTTNNSEGKRNKVERRTEITNPNTVGRIWNPGMMTSERGDWATPRQLFEMLDREFNFTLDACANEHNLPRDGIDFISPDQDALQAGGWYTKAGGSVWLNPPYGRGIGKWIEKALRESRICKVTVVCLLPARTDTKWFHELCLKGEIRFLQGRLCFDENRKKRAPFPSMLVIFR